MYAQMLPVSEACALLLSLRMPSQDTKGALSHSNP